jgi:hypothetical protein
MAAREALIHPKDWLAATDAELLPAIPGWPSASREEAEPAID